MSSTTPSSATPSTGQTAPRIAIIGKGALGLLFADIACAHLGHEAVSFVMDEQRLARDATRPYRVNGREVNFHGDTPENIAAVDMVIVATKTPALPAVLPLIDPLLKEDTCILSVLNGILSEGEIAARYGWEHVCGTVAQGMDAMRIDNEMTYANPGEIRIGALPHTPAALVEKAASILAATGIPFSQWDDIEYRMWAKLMLNAGINQVCCAFNATYGEVVSKQDDGGYHNSKLFRLFVSAMREVVSVARAEGIALKEHDLTEMVATIERLHPDSMPSMAQDGIMHNRTEVDAFAGEVCRRARKHSILVPVNEFLYHRIRSLEASWNHD